METSMIVAFIALCWIYFGGYLDNNRYSKHREILTKTIQNEYDYVIVGGGTAGSVLASRLSENKSVTVLLIEAGGFFDEDPRFYSFVNLTGLKHSKYDWSYYTEPQTRSCFGLTENRSFCSRGRVLGGSSLLGDGIYARGSRQDFDNWAANGCKGWSYKEVLPYFVKSEDILIDNLKTSKYHRIGGRMGVSEAAITELGELILKASGEMGYNVTDYNGAEQKGFNRVQLHARKGTKESTPIRYTFRPIRRINLDIAIQTLVTEIVVKDKAAAGVIYIRNGLKHLVKARKEVILSAGAINSPKLLMLSGIGPKEHLQELNIPVIVDLPVGENLQDHMSLALFLKTNVEIINSSDVHSSLLTRIERTRLNSGPEVSAFVSLNEKVSPDLQIEFISSLINVDGMNFRDEIRNEIEQGNKHSKGFTVLIRPSYPNSRGRVRLHSADPYDNPIIDPGYLTDERDITEFISGIKFVERFSQTKSIKDLGVDLSGMKMSFCSKYQLPSDEFWECIVRHLAVTSYHPSCTCKMAANNESFSVLDFELRVKGIQGLRVVDASSFPSITSGDISAPVVMLAEKAADLILGRDSVQYFAERFTNV